MRYYDIDGIYNLLAGVVRLARHDAKRDPKAAAWLDSHYPQWREIAERASVAADANDEW